MLMKFLRRGAIGFPLGILISLVISWAGGNEKFVSDLLVQRVGSVAGALTLNLLLSGIFGFLCMGGTVFYEIENWSLLKATFLHYLIVVVCFAPLALFLGWATRPVELLIMTGVQTVCFFLIWLIMFLRYRAEVRELNELNANREAAHTDGTES